MSREFLTPEDRQIMISQGITEETIVAQLALFRKGTPWIKLRRPCTVGDGIVVSRADELEGLSRKYAEAVADGRVMKFVPASGAASRMFQVILQGHKITAQGSLVDVRIILETTVNHVVDIVQVNNIGLNCLQVLK